MAPRIGQKVPEFSLPDADGRLRTLEEFAKQGKVMLAFFPFAFSGTCDKEMCMFRDGFTTLKDSGAQIVGISADSCFSLRAFAHTYNLQFPLLSDFNRKVSKLYGVLQDSWVSLGYKGVPKRSIFIVDERQILRYRWVSEVPSNEPPYQEVRRAIEKQTA